MSQPQPANRLKTGFEQTKSALRERIQSLKIWYGGLVLWKRILVILGGCLSCILVLIALIYRNAIFAFLVSIADKFAALKYSHLLMFFLLVIVSFPPFIGYTALSMLSGLAYGFPNGFPVLVLGTCVGSSLCFLLFSRVLNERAKKLALRSERFSRLITVLKEDSFFLLFLFRLCPLPYSMSNAALSAIPSVSFSHFIGATVCSSPKLLIPVFVGSRISKAEKDANVSWANFFGAFMAIIASSTISYIIYIRMTAISPPQPSDYELSDDEANEFEVVE